TPGNASVAASSTQQFSATGKYSDGSSKDLTSSVLWSSSDTSVASVNNAGLATGVVVGVVTVTAQFGAMQDGATLNVTNAGTNLTGITLSPAAASVPVNTTQQFTATGNYSDGSSRDLTALVTWGSSSTAVATVDANGLVTAVAAGSTNISATLGSISNSTSLTVTAPTISSISVTPVGLTLGIGINQQYTATATYSDGSSQDLVNGVTWTSSTTSVATVNNSGLVTTVGAGTTTITATVGSFSDSSTLTVVAAHLLSIAVSPATPSIAVGTTQQFSAVGTFDDGSTQLSQSAPQVWQRQSELEARQ
ncbi:MAG: ATP-dependent DNA ligase, partial [Acidobacteria bacterium]